MARQRTLTIPQSLSLAKMWFKLLTVNGGMIKWTFWTMNEIQFWQICGEAGIQNLMDFPIPYARNTTSLKVMLKCVVSYLSKGYFEGDLDTWLINPVVPAPAPDGGVELPPGGGLAAERAALIGSTLNCEGSSVSAMTLRAKEVLQTLEYQEGKMYLGEEVVEQFNIFNPLNEASDDLRNLVIRRELTKARAQEKLSSTLEALEALFSRLKDFYAREPGEGAYEGCLFAIGDAFNDNIDQVDLDRLIVEATNRDQNLMMRVSGNIHNLRDIPALYERYNHLLNEYQEINTLRTDTEDQEQEIHRKMKIFMLELNSLKEEITTTHEEDMVVLVIKDYLDQLSDLKKKLGGIRSLTTNEIDTPRVNQLEEDRDGVTFSSTYTVDDWMLKTRRKLLLQRETQERENRKQENQDKLLLQETLRAVSRTKI